MDSKSYIFSIKSKIFSLLLLNCLTGFNLLKCHSSLQSLHIELHINLRPKFSTPHFTLILFSASRAMFITSDIAYRATIRIWESFLTYYSMLNWAWRYWGPIEFSWLKFWIYNGFYLLYSTSDKLLYFYFSFYLVPN